MLAGLTQLVTGAVDSLAMLCVMRVAHAACNSITNPLFYSLVADYFPRNQRGTANSILQSANYIGIALSSISVIIIGKLGWRPTYTLMGVLGIALGAFSNFFIKEPH